MSIVSAVEQLYVQRGKLYQKVEDQNGKSVYLQLVVPKSHWEFILQEALAGM